MSHSDRADSQRMDKPSERWSASAGMGGWWAKRTPPQRAAFVFAAYLLGAGGMWLIIAKAPGRGRFRASY